MLNADGRFQFNYSDPEDYIPAIKTFADRNFERDKVAIVQDAKDHSGIVTRFNRETRTLILSTSHDIGADDLKTHVKAARAREGRIDRLVLYIPQDCWSEDMHFYLRNHFDRDVTLEQGTSRIALVRDLTIRHSANPTPERTAAPAATPTVTLSPEEESRELDRQIAALLRTRGTDPLYLRTFEGQRK